MKISFYMFLIIFLISCNNQHKKEAPKTSSDSTDKNIVYKRSMKGFDLYAWKKDGSMFFSLLPGTNREKISKEIYDLKNAVEGVSAIENKINQIDTGEYIFLNPIQIDTSDLKQLLEFMKRKKFKVTVIP